MKWNTTIPILYTVIHSENSSLCLIRSRTLFISESIWSKNNHFKKSPFKSTNKNKYRWKTAMINKCDKMFNCPFEQSLSIWFENEQNKVFVNFFTDWDLVCEKPYSISSNTFYVVVEYFTFLFSHFYSVWCSLSPPPPCRSINVVNFKIENQIELNWIYSTINFLDVIHVHCFVRNMMKFWVE